MLTSLTPDEILERSQWDYFWATEDVVVVDRPELRYVSCPRDVPYLNMVVRSHMTEQMISEAIDEVIYAHAGRCSRWVSFSHIHDDWVRDALSCAGYQPGPRHDVYFRGVTQEPARELSGTSRPFIVHPVDSQKRLRECESVARRVFGAHAVQEADRTRWRRDLKLCCGAGARVHRFVAYDRQNGAPISSGGLTLHPALNFGFLWGGATVPEARRKGAYSAILACRMARARQSNIGFIGLYARYNSSAPIVARHGFDRFGSVAFWDRLPPRSILGKQSNFESMTKSAETRKRGS